MSTDGFSEKAVFQLDKVTITTRRLIATHGKDYRLFDIRGAELRSEKENRLVFLLIVIAVGVDAALVLFGVMQLEYGRTAQDKAWGFAAVGVTLALGVYGALWLWYYKRRQKTYPRHQVFLKTTSGIEKIAATNNEATARQLVNTIQNLVSGLEKEVASRSRGGGSSGG